MKLFRNWKGEYLMVKLAMLFLIALTIWKPVLFWLIPFGLMTPIAMIYVFKPEWVPFKKALSKEFHEMVKLVLE